MENSSTNHIIKNDTYYWENINEDNVCKLKQYSYVRGYTLPMSQKYMTMDEEEYNEQFGQKKGFVTSKNHKKFDEIIIYDTTLNKEINLISTTCKMSVSIEKLKKRTPKRKLENPSEKEDIKKIRIN